VFLFIGDGMSFPQIQMAEEFVQKTEKRGLKISSMPYRAVTTTHAAGDQFVTDSAAAGTAIACGIKTQNGVLGLDAEGVRVQSVAEFALQNGRKVGILSSVTINHATPAAFYTHNASRSSEYEIGLDLVASGFHYFGGGGVARRNDKEAKQYCGDIYDLAKEAGYIVCRTAEEIQSLKPGAEKVLAFGSDSDLLYAIDGNKEGRRLVDFTKQAIELLDNPDGFFMMVEGGKIDWACHGNDAAATVWEMIEFDAAISAAFDFAEKNPGDVLIVVTGDHETGALTVSAPGTGSHVYLSLLSKQKASREALVALTGKFVKDNKENAPFEQFRSVITEQCGLVFTEEGKWQPGNLNLTINEMKELENDFATTKKAIEENGSGKDKVVQTMLRLLNNKSGVTWSSGGHTALPVCTLTWGNQADQIALNIRDNTDIARHLKRAISQRNKSQRY
jgi:alkaline phosphatase